MRRLRPPVRPTPLAADATQFATDAGQTASWCVLGYVCLGRVHSVLCLRHESIGSGGLSWCCMRSVRRFFWEALLVCLLCNDEFEHRGLRPVQKYMYAR